MSSDMRSVPDLKASSTSDFVKSARAYWVTTSSISFEIILLTKQEMTISYDGRYIANIAFAEM